MTRPTTPPEVSPDGRFYWDGQKWMPFPTAAEQPPPLTAPVPIDPKQVEQQWVEWAKRQPDISKGLAKPAAKGAVLALHAGATSDEAAEAARRSAQRRANNVATTGFVLSILALATAAVDAFVLGTRYIPYALLTASGSLLLSAAGRASVSRKWLAYGGIALSLIAWGLALAAILPK